MVNSRGRVLRTGTPGDGVLKLDAVVSGAVWRDGRGREGGLSQRSRRGGREETVAGAGPGSRPWERRWVLLRNWAELGWLGLS